TESYRRARRMGRRLEPQSDAAAFHEWRKCVKDLWYHCRLFKARSRSADQFAGRLDTLGSILGLHHNLETVRLALVTPSGHGPVAKATLGCIARRQAALAARAVRLWRPLFSKRARTFRRKSQDWAHSR